MFLLKAVGQCPKFEGLVCPSSDSSPPCHFLWLVIKYAGDVKLEYTVNVFSS